MSKSQVSRLYVEIDQRVNAFVSRPLEGAGPKFLARFGKREVLGVVTGPSEPETFWTDFLDLSPTVACAA
ncbi:Transposase, Mutator family [Jannaschia seosinensis]|uniref:Transposase, Mutator family n=1 Tax=Jannaschia seosinensis TaxID=313367 RepID=A0A0M7BBR9_9RHOB|nr:Transposase, Mutator family [Jannaschia seosinensis]